MRVELENEPVVDRKPSGRDFSLSNLTYRSKRASYKLHGGQFFITGTSSVLWDRSNASRAVLPWPVLYDDEFHTIDRTTTGSSGEPEACL
jgi:hypothetical protein